MLFYDFLIFSFFLFFIQVVSKVVDKPDNKLNDEKLVESKKNKKVSESEFVSDTFQTTEKDLEEVKEGMRKLGIDTLVQDAVKTGKHEN